MFIVRYLLYCFGCDLDSVTFIDLEYGGPNFRGFDIGDFFCEFAGKKLVELMPHVCCSVLGNL